MLKCLEKTVVGSALSYWNTHYFAAPRAPAFVCSTVRVAIYALIDIAATEMDADEFFSVALQIRR